MSRDALIIAFAIFAQIPVTLWHGWLSWSMHRRSEANWERMNNLLERERTVTQAIEKLETMARSSGSSNPIEEKHFVVSLHETQKH